MNHNFKVSIDRFLAIYLISLSFFRIDFAGGNAPFLITPQLLISLFLILLILLKKDVLNQKLSLRTGHSVVGALLLLIYFFLTIIFGFKGVLQLKKMTLFTEIIISSIAFFYLFKTSKNKKEIIRFWIKGTLLIQVVWLLVQFSLFFTNTHQSNTAHITFFNYLNPFSHYVGSYFPRINGGFLDPNVFSYYMSFIFFVGKSTKTLRQIESYFVMVLILFSFSRSGIASFVLVYLLQTILTPRKINVKKLVKKARFLLLFLLGLSVTFYYYGLFERIQTALELRFLNSSTSTNIHTEILFYGFANSYESIKTLFIGHGFMSAPFYIFENFRHIGSEWKYVNFHSDYATMIFETGLLGFFLFYYVIGQLVNRKKIKLLAVYVFSLILLQGIFYQQFNFHYFWIIFFLTIEITENKTKRFLDRY